MCCVIQAVCMKILILSFLSRSWCLCMALAMWVLCFDWLRVDFCWGVCALSFASGLQPARPSPGEGSLTLYFWQFFLLLETAVLVMWGNFQMFFLSILNTQEKSEDLMRWHQAAWFCRGESCLDGALLAARVEQSFCASSSPLWHLLEKTKRECYPDMVWKLTERNKLTHMGLSRTLSAKAAPLALSSYFMPWCLL